MANWTIRKLECFTNYNNTENVVQSLLWNIQSSRVIGANTISRSLNAKTDIAVGEGPYIPFNELTEQTVLDWLFDNLGDVKQDIEAGLELELDDIETPQKSTLTPPWG
jgi:hypothetical protein